MGQILTHLYSRISVISTTYCAFKQYYQSRSRTASSSLMALKGPVLVAVQKLFFSTRLQQVAADESAVDKVKSVIDKYKFKISRFLQDMQLCNNLMPAGSAIQTANFRQGHWSSCTRFPYFTAFLVSLLSFLMCPVTGEDVFIVHDQTSLFNLMCVGDSVKVSSSPLSTGDHIKLNAGTYMHNSLDENSFGCRYSHTVY